MKKIEKSKEEQDDELFQAVEDVTKKTGLSTEPADRPRAEAAIIKLYAIAGKRAPKIVWCGSPLSQVLTRSAVISLGASVGDGAWNDVRNKLRNELTISVSDSVWGSVRDSVGKCVRDGGSTSVGKLVWESVLGTWLDSVLIANWKNVWDRVWDNVWDRVWDNVWASVTATMRQSVRDNVRPIGWGRLNSYRALPSALVFDIIRSCQTKWSLDLQTEKVQQLWELAQSAGWTLPHENICFVSERHSQLHHTTPTNDWYQLHNDFGPAIAYPDGWALYYIHGVRLTEQIVMRPESLTLQQIADERNAEMRRIMMERFDYEKYLRESDAKLIDSCAQDHKLKGLSTAKLWSVGEITMLDVLNSTPEPDGTTKRYVIPVDGTLYDGRAGRECVAASASTWRKRGDKTELVFAQPEDYAPEFES